MAWLAYDKQCRSRAACDLSLGWDMVDLELWTVTFSGLAKPHCPICSSPYHHLDDCPSDDQSRRSHRTGLLVCFDFNKPSGCQRRSCVYPRVTPLQLQQPLRPFLHPTAVLQRFQVVLHQLQQTIKLQLQQPSLSTPIDVLSLELELSSHPDRAFVTTLIHALKYGTCIGYNGPPKSRVSRNLISAHQHPDVISANLQKEIKLGRVAGPFPSAPLPNFQCHPVGVVPKKHSSDWCTIYHLSYPEGDSINYYIPKDPYSLQYVQVDNAIRILKALGPGAFMSKTDLKSPFHLIRIHPSDWNLVGIYWQSQYYVYLYLPFGLRSAPYIFNHLSDALEWILKHNYGLKNVIYILNYFFVAESTRLDCFLSFSTLLKLFMSVKAPTVASKTIGPSQVIEFMGIVLDSVRMEARLPEDKLTRIKELLKHFKLCHSARLVDPSVRL